MGLAQTTWETQTALAAGARWSGATIKAILKTTGQDALPEIRQLTKCRLLERSAVLSI
jgi:hypothetical protein